MIDKYVESPTKGKINGVRGIWVRIHRDNSDLAGFDIMFIPSTFSLRLAQLKQKLGGKAINAWRILIITNACVTAYLLYSVHELHKVVADLGSAMVLMADVVGFAFDLVFEKFDEIIKFF